MEAVRARRPADHGRRPGRAGRATSGGPASRILQLQAAAGNRAVAAMLQRRGASGLLDAPIALASPTPQVLDDELVPIGEAPGRFDGFATSAEARALAARSPEVVVVVSDGKKYHALRSTATALGGKTAPPRLPRGWTVVEVVEPSRTTTDREFRDAYDAATKLSGDDKVQAYRRLLVQATHLELGQTGWSPTKDAYEEGKVNAALWLGSAGRHVPAKVVPTGNAPLPKTAILIANSTFAEGPTSVRTTLLHEARHAYHRARTLALIEQWRGVRTTDSLDAWRAWLKGMKRSSKVPTEVYATSAAATDVSAGTASTETYSYLHGFMYRFRRDADAARDPDTLDATATRALHFRMVELHGMGEFWESAGQDVQQEALDQIAAFAAGLSAHHREHLRRFMTTNAAGAGYAPRVFYAKLRARL